MENRVPPQGITLEQSILGACFLENENAVKIIDLLSEDDFYKYDHRIIFNGIFQTVKDGREIDIITFQPYVNKLTDPLALTNVISEFTDYNLDGKIEELKRYSQLRKIIKYCSNITARAYEQESIPADLINELERDLFVFTESQDGHVKRIDEYTDFIINNFGMFYRSQYKTGITDIDKNIMIHDGLTYILAGEPGSGKTSFTLNFLTDLAMNNKIPTAIFSQEASGEMLNYRLGFTYGKGKEFDRYASGADKLHGINFYVDDTAILTPYKLRAKALRMIKKYGIKVFGLDYLQLMDAPGENQNVRVANMSKAIKALAKETNTVWFVLSQLTKKGLDKEPDKGDLRDSGQIAQDARGIYLLFVEDKEQDSIVTFKCDKQSYGSTNWKERIYFDRENNKFANLNHETKQNIKEESWG